MAAPAPLRRLDDALAVVEDVAIAAATAVLAVVLFANVLLRYVFRSPFAWLEEVVVMVFMWMVFVGVSACFRSHQHLRIDVLVRYLPPAMAWLAGLAAVLVTYALLVILVKLGYDYAQFVARNRTPVLAISAAWLYVGMPLGMAFSVVHVTRQLLDEGPAGIFRSVMESEDEEPGRP